MESQLPPGNNSSFRNPDAAEAITPEVIREGWHQLNNHLSVIDGYVTLALKRMEKHKTLERDLLRLKEESSRVVALVHSLAPRK